MQLRDESARRAVRGGHTAAGRGARGAVRGRPAHGASRHPAAGGARPGRPRAQPGSRGAAADAAADRRDLRLPQGARDRCAADGPRGRRRSRAGGRGGGGARSPGRPGSGAVVAGADRGARSHPPRDRRAAGNSHLLSAYGRCEDEVRILLAVLRPDFDARRLAALHRQLLDKLLVGGDVAVQALTDDLELAGRSALLVALRRAETVARALSR